MDKIDFNANPLTFFNNYILFDKLPLLYRKSLDRESTTFYNYIDKEGNKAYNYIINFQKCSNENDHKTRITHYITEIENLLNKQSIKDVRIEVIEVLEYVLLKLDNYLAENYNIYPIEKLREKIRVNHNLFGFIGNMTTFQIVLFYTILEKTEDFKFAKTKFKDEKFEILSQKYGRNKQEIKEHFALVERILKDINKPNNTTKKGFKGDIIKVLEELNRYDETKIILEELEPQSEKSYPKSISLANDLLKKLD